MRRYRSLIMLLLVVTLAPLVRIEMRCPRRDSPMSDCKQSWKVVWPWWRGFLPAK